MFLLSDSLAFSRIFQDLSLGFLRDGFQFKCPIFKGDLLKIGKDADSDRTRGNRFELKEERF